MNSERAAEKLRFERRLWGRGVRTVAGVDEAGRGPLAGPVVAAAVIVPQGFFLPQVDDSKKLTPEMRAQLFDLIMSGSGGVGVGVVGHEVIDQINILNATFLAMNMAVRNLPRAPEHLLIDGNRFAGSALPFSTIVDGDARSFSIGAASIIAKVTRDRLMLDFDRVYPGYGFAAHKGYGTPAHREAISRLGPCPIHRKSFRLLHEQGTVP